MLGELAAGKTMFGDSDDRSLLAEVLEEVRTETGSTFCVEHHVAVDDNHARLRGRQRQHRQDAGELTFEEEAGAVLFDVWHRNRPLIESRCGFPRRRCKTSGSGAFTFVVHIHQCNEIGVVRHDEAYGTSTTKLVGMDWKAI